MNQIFRVSMSFAIVSVAYWAYALVVVPAIAPSTSPEDRQKVSHHFIMGAQQRAEAQAKELSALFPPGSWELAEKPKVLESDQAKLLVGDYTTKDDGRVFLKPCTIIFFPKKELHDAPLAERQPIIMEAPEGALLQFDQAFDFSRAPFSKLKLIGGRIPGPVTIRSQGKPDNPDDDLRVTTRDVHISEQWITTDETVRFRFGKHGGSGRRMRIELEQEEDAGKKKSSKGLQIAGIRSFQLRKIDSLRMLIEEKDTKKESRAAEQPLAQNAADARSQKTPDPKLIPVEVECTGGFRFDVPERRAAFQDHVVVSRFRTDGPADQLLCDELVIHFDQRKPKKTDGTEQPDSTPRKKKKGIEDLEPSWLEARGIHRLVEIHSTVEKVEGFAREMQYHLADEDDHGQRIVLQDPSGKEPVRLQQGNNHFVAKWMEYRPQQGSVGQQLVADGPGVVNARLDEASEDRFTATWQKELRLRPHEKNQVISLTGGATLDYGPVGKLSATSIYFFLVEKPKPNENAAGGRVAGKQEPAGKLAANLQPDRMRADGDVTIESEQVSGNVDQFEVWFEIDESSPNGNRSDERFGSGRQASPIAATNHASSPNYQPGAAASVFPGVPAPAGLPAKKKSKQHFNIKSRVLQANVLLRETALPDGKTKREAEVTNLIMLDNVELIETKTDKPDVEPIVAKGDRIQVQDASLRSMSINLFGRPAEFIGRGLGLTGANINLNCGINRLWVNGFGTMRLPPMEKDLMGNSNKEPEPILIKWQQEMDFDGRTIVFLDQVLAETKHQKLYTEQLTATLTERIDFAEADRAMSGEAGTNRFNAGKERVELLQLTCCGGVRLDSSGYDELDRLESIEEAEASQLKIDKSTGKIYAKGPGFIKTVRRGDAEDSQQFGLGGMITARPRSAYANAPNHTTTTSGNGPAKKEDKLNYLKIDFQGFVDGDIPKGDIDANSTFLMSFNKEVQGTFGKVLDWQQTLPEDDPDALGDEGANLRCQRLELAKTPSPTGGEPDVGMVATGNVSIEGSKFTARGTRASYSRQKDLLILQGDGRTEAELYHQERVGTVPQEHHAKTIQYWRKQNRYKIGGSQSFQLQLNSSR